VNVEKGWWMQNIWLLVPVACRVLFFVQCPHLPMTTGEILHVDGGVHAVQ